VRRHLPVRNAVETMRRRGACIMMYLIGAPFTGLLGAICSIRDVEQQWLAKASTFARKIMNSTLSLPHKAATDLASQSPATSCTLLDNILTIDVKGTAGLCCMTSLGSDFEFGNFVESPIENVLATRKCQNICGECMKVNIQLYQSGHPWFGVLETFDYDSVPIILTDRSGGCVDSISLVDNNLAIKGWSADLMVGAAARIELRIDNRPVYRMFPNVPRPDIASRFGNSMLTNTGFGVNLAVTGSLSLPTPRLELFSEQVNGDLIRLY